MSSENETERVRRVLRLLAEHLERHLEGDPSAFEGLPQILDDPALTGGDLEAAALVLRSLDNASWGGLPAMPDTLPGPQAQRMLSAEERGTLAPEAWGYLLELRRRGALDAGQFERVLDTLAGFDERPVGLALAREIAARVVLQLDLEEAPQESPHGDLDVAH